MDQGPDAVARSLGEIESAATCGVTGDGGRYDASAGCCEATYKTIPIPSVSTVDCGVGILNADIRLPCDRMLDRGSAHMKPTGWAVDVKDVVPKVDKDD